MSEEPQVFPAYQPPRPPAPRAVRVAHPQSAKILGKVFKAFGKRGRGNSLALRRRKKARVV